MALTGSTRPGAVRILDHVVSQLLLAGDEVDSCEWRSSPEKHLHAILQLQADFDEPEEDVGLTDSDQGMVSDPDETLAQEERLERRVAALRKKEGLASDRTLKQVFKLLDCLIGQYKLNRTERILQEVSMVCKERGGDWHVKHIQSLAFCRWKQYRFKEALTLFLEQQGIVGPSAALCENIGHTYSSLGDLPKAEEYFTKAIELMKHGSFGNKGGIYMGLGLVRDRMGKTREALPILHQALDHYEREHTREYQQLDSSIIAKAHMSIGKAYEKLEDLESAAKHMGEALSIFKRTVGGDSPLTAHAMGSLGKVRAAQGPSKQREALSLLKGALTLEVSKDAFHLETAWELLTKLKDLHMEEAKERHAQLPASQHGSHLAALNATYSQYLPLVAQARARITEQHERDDIGTLAVFYKTAGELCMLAQEYMQGEELLHEALRLFDKVPNFDCRSLIEGCNMLLSIAESNNPQRSSLHTRGKGKSPDHPYDKSGMVPSARHSNSGKKGGKSCRWDE
mmetsp:Transcript_14143/g.23533  ORF Transcript_14143/g.23533 Transcript_14143/m.23533 type:complete len:512 (+) Transcript_14143:124-1659(+)|eukprot:CAMPEP_0119336956 /NCGR_PEP_ID=MMETSP1333-20130426/92949_1 /TAXON_ID=418940 /ORGANISM="Scyphosphaera apsteinii, Strain RCC1455" /LENGTH=511 /DNA_ID=CAMNT_0007347893 /DNA_START=112 /DNA_END=1647 /DNA_ORIENTATION=-